MSPRVAAAVLLAACALASGCSSDDQSAEQGGAAEQSGPDEARAEPPLTLRRASCPPDLANCSTATGRILYVERVDPDGDGDAHFVLLSREGITAPGVSVVDVKRSLRPRPLPGPGERLSAAGPVYRGSHGQRQIEAIELHVAR
jgi:hypothetical protein